MIYHDRVTVVCKEKSGGRVTEAFDGSVPAIVTPLPANVNFDPAGSTVTTRLHIVLKPFSYLIPANAGSIPPAAEGATQILFAWGPYPTLLLDGRVERHLLRGRLHHYEAIVKI